MRFLRPRPIADCNCHAHAIAHGAKWERADESNAQKGRKVEEEACTSRAGAIGPVAIGQPRRDCVLGQERGSGLSSAAATMPIKYLSY